MERDIINYDYLSVSVKSSQLDRILACYQALGWSEVERSDDRDFFDMKYLVLSRPHYIKNKDRLQYIQVKTENLLNSLSHTYAYKHARSTSLAITEGVFALCFLVLGFVFTFAVKASYSLPIYIISYCLSALLFAAIIYPLAFLRKKESKFADESIKERIKKIDELMKQVKVLISGGSEERIILSADEQFEGVPENIEESAIAEEENYEG